MPYRIGPRWLIWLILAYGLLEIPWVVYLMFSQVTEATAHHARLAALGLYGGAAILSVVTAWGVLRTSRLLAVVSVMTSTWLAAGVFLSLVISSLTVVWAALVGAVTAALVALRSLGTGRTPRWSAPVLLVVTVVLAVHLSLTVAESPARLDADHLRLLVVLYDSAEVAALLGLGLSLHRGAARAAIVFGSAGMVLFVLDAFVNIVAVPSGQAFTAAVFYAIVGEVPSLLMCSAGVVLAMRSWNRSQIVGPGVA